MYGGLERQPYGVWGCSWHSAEWCSGIFSFDLKGPCCDVTILQLKQENNKLLFEKGQKTVTRYFNGLLGL